MDAACALAAGATCLSDVEAMTAQEEIYGPGGGASDSTMLRALDELAGRLGGDGLPGRRLARATAAARVTAWAGASHDVIDYLTSVNTAPEHGNRGRRVEYTIGWPVDERTVAGIGQLRESDWGVRMTTPFGPTVMV